jgi:hypothetical protein
MDAKSARRARLQSEGIIGFSISIPKRSSPEVRRNEATKRTRGGVAAHKSPQLAAAKGPKARGVSGAVGSAEKCRNQGSGGGRGTGLQHSPLTRKPGRTALDARRITQTDHRAGMENEWVPAMTDLLDIDPTALPVIWDADFLYGPKATSGDETYVLCEINVSSVLPIPDGAPAKIARCVARRLAARVAKVAPA